MAFSLVAAGLALVAARGKWIVFRVLVGIIALFVAIVAGLQWATLAWVSAQPPSDSAGGQMYIGWNPRALFSRETLIWASMMLLLLGLIVVAGRKRARAKLQGRA